MKADIAVIGGGAAGVAAAVACARLGKKTIMIERNQYLGGKATAAEVGTICGLYLYNRSTVPRLNVFGFAREFAEKIETLSQKPAFTNSEGLHFLPYVIDDFKSLCEELLFENKVEVLYNAMLENIHFEENQIKFLGIETNSGQIELHCNAVIDCSGTSILSGVDTYKSIQNEVYQAAAQVFSLDGIPILPENNLNFALIRDISRGIKNGLLSADYDRTYVVPASNEQGRITLKMAIPLVVMNTPENNLDLRALALDRIATLVDFLNAHSQVFKHASVCHIADEVGIRTGERMLGKYILSGKDVLSCRKFEDAIAFGNWPIEKWALHRLVQTNYFEENNWFEIPMECLISSQIENLFAAGRSMSADEDAIASARVMGTCLQTGFAAGVLAAYYTNGVSQKEALRYIQNQQIFK